MEGLKKVGLAGLDLQHDHAQSTERRWRARDGFRDRKTGLATQSQREGNLKDRNRDFRVCRELGHTLVRPGQGCRIKLDRYVAAVVVRTRRGCQGRRRWFARFGAQGLASGVAIELDTDVTVVGNA